MDFNDLLHSIDDLQADIETENILVRISPEHLILLAIYFHKLVSTAQS